MEPANLGIQQTYWYVGLALKTSITEDAHTTRTLRCIGENR